MGDAVTIHVGDCREVLRTLPDQSVNCCVTSPPYFGLRDYGVDGQIGLEAAPEEFVAELVAVFREVRRVLRDDGTLWLNLGDSYGAPSGNIFAGFNERYHGRGGEKQSHIGENAKSAATKGAYKNTRPKNLLGIPWRVAFALQADGWYLRQDIIWAKPNPMPESVRDRCTKAHEYLFLLSKGPRYYFDQDAIAEELAPASVARLSQDVDNQVGSARVPGKTNGTMKAVSRSRRNGFIRDGRSADHVLSGQSAAQHRADREESTYDVGRRNKRSVWTVPTQPFREAHFATYPIELIQPCILAGCPAGGVVLDPFGGAATTGVAADQLGRKAVLIEINPDYADIARRRIAAVQPGLPLGACA